ncbi:MAG: hypothetical protein ABNH26_08605 [Celeribacter sp.]|jgi:hypothetical protein
MNYSGPARCALFRQLVEDFGGYDAAAEYLKCSKGTISKMVHGMATIGCEHFGPLEDALGRAPITRLMATRSTLVDRETRAEAELFLTAAKESGELIQALVECLTGSNKGKAEVIKEGREALDAIGALLSQVEAGPDQ